MGTFIYYSVIIVGLIILTLYYAGVELSLM